MWCHITCTAARGPHYCHHLTRSESVCLCIFIPTCGNEMVINSSNTCAHKVRFDLKASQFLSKCPKNWQKKDVLLRLSVSNPGSQLWRATCGWMSAHSSVLQRHRTKCVGLIGLVRFSPVLEVMTDGGSLPVAHGPALGQSASGIMG